MRRAVQVSAAALCVGSYTGQNPITGLTTTFIAGVFVPVIVFDNRPVLFRSAINHIENVRVFDRVLDSRLTMRWSRSCVRTGVRRLGNRYLINRTKGLVLALFAAHWLEVQPLCFS